MPVTKGKGLSPQFRNIILLGHPLAQRFAKPSTTPPAPPTAPKLDLTPGSDPVKTWEELLQENPQQKGFLAQLAAAEKAGKLYSTEAQPAPAQPDPVEQDKAIDSML